MSFTDAVQIALVKKYLDFSGWARRSAYWWFALFSFLVGMVADVIDLAIGSRIVEYVAELALLLPGQAVGARRLHDTGRAAWWLLLILIPIMDSEADENKHGPNPKSGFYTQPLR